MQLGEARELHLTTKQQPAAARCRAVFLRAPDLGFWLQVRARGVPPLPETLVRARGEPQAACI